MKNKNNKKYFKEHNEPGIKLIPREEYVEPVLFTLIELIKKNKPFTL